MEGPHLRATLRTPEAVNVITRVLGPHIGETTARAATVAHCRKLGIDNRFVAAAQLDVLLEQLRSGLNVFVGRTRSAEVIALAKRELAVEEDR